jgi:hypothetical protein
MFARDRDLWALEPNLFTDVRFTSQRTLDGASIAIGGDGLSLALLAGTLTDARVVVGSVLDVVGVGLVEVAAITSDASATVSKLRADRDGPAVPVVSSAWTGTVSGWTFAPQIGSVHRRLLMALGLDPAGGGDPGPRGVDASSVLNGGELAHAEALGALAMIYSAVAPTSPPDSPIRAKAERYERWASAAMGSARAVLDLDDDGEADSTRLASLNTLRRA